MGLLDEPVGGLPAISWMAADKGDFVTGVILPQWENGEEVFFSEKQQTDMDTGARKSFDDGKPMLQFHFHFAGEIPAKPFADCSKQARARAAEEETVDDGIRQVIIKGYSEKGLRKALFDFKRKAGRFPGAGDRIKVTLTDDSYGKSGKGKLFTTAFAPATEDTLKVADEYRRANKPAPPAPKVAEGLLGGSGGGDFDDDPDF
jgi:hypothetical protein